MNHRDSKNTLITPRDIVVCNGNVGWVWKNRTGEYYVAWDLEGPSCEDSDSIKSLVEEGASLLVVGRMNIK